MVSFICPYLLACECYSHSDSCHYNESLDHGICDDCYHNTTGMFCEQCVVKFYRNMSKPLYDPEVCLREYTYALWHFVLYINCKFKMYMKICLKSFF